MTPGMLFGSIWNPKSTNNPEKHHPKNIAEETWNFIQKHTLKGAKVDAEVHEISTFPRKGAFEKPTIIAGVFAQNQSWPPSKST